MSAHAPGPSAAPGRAFVSWLDERIRQLEGRRPAVFEPADVPGGFRRAAVLMPLWVSDDRVHTALTLRSTNLSSHRGQISLPGGGVDPEDADATAAALREAWEELAIEPSNVTVRLRLDDAWSIQRYHVASFVGWCAQQPVLVPSEYEVERVIVADVERLMDPAIHTVKTVRQGDATFDIHYFDYDGDTIWGLTASILHGFFELLRGRALPSEQGHAETLRRYLALKEST